MISATRSRREDTASAARPAPIDDPTRITCRISPWPVYLHNDGTAACAAELVLGDATTSADFLYIFIGSFIGGGVVLNHHLYPGRSRYAGAAGRGCGGKTYRPMDSRSLELAVKQRHGLVTGQNSNR